MFSFSKFEGEEIDKIIATVLKKNDTIFYLMYLLIFFLFRFGCISHSGSAEKQYIDL